MRTIKKVSYIAPMSMLIRVSNEPLMAATSGGWTTTDREHGHGIVEEDKDNPYDDDTFG